MEVRKLPLENLAIDNIERGVNHSLIIEWSSPDIGFGEFTLLVAEDSTIHARTECMDNQDDKEFTRRILNLLVDHIFIDE